MKNKNPLISALAATALTSFSPTYASATTGVPSSGAFINQPVRHSPLDLMSPGPIAESFVSRADDGSTAVCDVTSDSQFAVADLKSGDPKIVPTADAIVENLHHGTPDEVLFVLAGDKIMIVWDDFVGLDRENTVEITHKSGEPLAADLLSAAKVHFELLEDSFMSACGAPGGKFIVLDEAIGTADDVQKVSRDASSNIDNAEAVIAAWKRAHPGALGTQKSISPPKLPGINEPDPVGALTPKP